MVEKRNNLSAWRTFAAATAAVALACGVSPAPAGPQGEAVLRGQATFSRAGSLTEIRAAHNSIIRYSSFDIGAAETVRFILPGATSRVLNRIDSATPSQIDGRLESNGRVYLVNPAGVIFGATAVVDVARLYAAAGTLTDRDFLAGRSQYRDLSGPVENHGTIRAARAHLAGQTVENTGSIVAEEGLVVMAAGKDVYVGQRDGHVLVKVEPAVAAGPGAGGGAGLGAGDIFSVAARNSGTVKARQIAVAADGATAEISGTLDATGAAGHAGGRVTVQAARVSVQAASIDASGPAGGGSVDIRGSSGSGAAAAGAPAGVNIDNASVIHADATATGNGGHVVIFGQGAAGVFGTITARGSASGAGGIVETAGGFLWVARAPDVSAARGRAGTWKFSAWDVDVVDDDVRPVLEWREYWGSGSRAGYAPDSPVSPLAFSELKTGLDRASEVIIGTLGGGAGPSDVTWKTTGQIDPTVIGAGADRGGNRTIVLSARNNVVLGIGINATYGDTATAAERAASILYCGLQPDSDADGAGAICDASGIWLSPGMQPADVSGSAMRTFLIVSRSASSPGGDPFDLGRTPQPADLPGQDLGRLEEEARHLAKQRAAARVAKGKPADEPTSRPAVTARTADNAVSSAATAGDKAGASTFAASGERAAAPVVWVIAPLARARP